MSHVLHCPYCKGSAYEDWGTIYCEGCGENANDCTCSVEGLEEDEE